MNCPGMLINGERADRVPAEDRGFLYGDGLFETVAVRAGRAVALDLHVARLADGCRRLGLECPDPELLDKEIGQVCGEQARAVAKVIITRGQGARGYPPPADCVPLRLVAAYPWPDNVPERQRRGVAVKSGVWRLADQGPLAGLKHLSRIEQVMAGREIAAGDYDEQLLVGADGCLVEAVSSNVFVVMKETVMTPRLDRCGVAGTMRERVLTAAEALGLKSAVAPLPMTILSRCDEMFLTNSISGVVPVRQINRRSLAIGAVTRRLQETLHRDWPA